MVTINSIFEIFIWSFIAGTLCTMIATFLGWIVRKKNGKRQKITEAFSTDFFINDFMVSMTFFVLLSVLCIWKFGFSIGF